MQKWHSRFLMRMTIKGFIFDLDGVIVDTAHFHFLAWRKTAAELGFTLTPELNEQLKGVSRINSLKTILDWAGKTISQEQFDHLTSDKNIDYLSHVESMNAKDILPGVVDFLNQLKAKGYPVALGSASKNARKILEKVGLHNTFDTIVDGTNVSKAKPDPEVFLVGASQLGVLPESCVVFEDSVAGVTAAKTGGMLAVGIGQEAHLGHADFVFDGFTAFPSNFIDQLISN